MSVTTEPNVGLTWFDTADPRVMPGVSAPGYQFCVRTDVPSLYYKSGPGATDWTLIGEGSGPSPSSSQRFKYTVTGSEPDLSNLVIPLPAARANANYNVQVTMGTFSFILSPAVPVATRTTTQFVLSLSGAATAADTFDFVVQDNS